MADFIELEANTDLIDLEDDSGQVLLELQPAVGGGKPKTGRAQRRFWPQQNIVKIPHYFQFSLVQRIPFKIKTIKERLISTVVSIPLVRQVMEMVSPRLAVSLKQFETKSTIQIPATRIHADSFSITITIIRQHITIGTIRYYDTFLTNDPVLDAIILDDDAALADALNDEKT